jgi:hypothetical protein
LMATEVGLGYVLGLLVIVIATNGGFLILGYWMGRNHDDKPLVSIRSVPKDDTGPLHDYDPYKEALEGGRDHGIPTMPEDRR